MRCRHLPLLLIATTAAAETVTVDANANRHAIDPRIYGVAFASTAQLQDLNCPLNRQGGNACTQYNWQINASNRGNDWYFESIGSANAAGGGDGDDFITSAKAAGAEAMLTIPMVDWVAKLGSNRAKLCSFSQAKYGAQTGNDWQWYADAGNGVSQATGQNITGNDPNDAHVAANSTFQLGYMQHLTAKWGAAAAGGLKYYIMDNEPSIWHSTHRDIHPTGATMDELKTKIVDYAGKAKANDPGAIVCAPEEWGWSGYFYSGYDQQYCGAHGWSYAPDRSNHGGWDYLPWLLDQLRQSSAAAGKRLLDVFTVHYYPQGGEFSNDTSTTMQALRNKSTRALWDPNYVDASWIGTQVKLIPRLRSWVNTYYAGTQVGITEYNWGAEGHINGATTQADIYGIFGREGLDLATRWTTPDPSTPTYKAMKLYRNYDGAKSGFGDTSVGDTVTNPDNLSSFAAVRSSDGALTVMVINKVTTASAVTLSLANFTAGATAQVWQLTSANAISRLSDLGVSGNSLSTSVPAQSVTLFVIAKGGTTPTNAAPTIATAASASPNPVSGTTTTASVLGADDGGEAALTYTWTATSGPAAVSFSANGTNAAKTSTATFSASGTYVLMATVRDAGGLTATSSVSVSVTVPTAPPPPTGTGLTGAYYDNQDFTNLKVQRVDATVSFDWGTGAPARHMGSDTFSVRWTGQVQPQYSETYTFFTTSDDGIRLWVNGQLLVDNWTSHSATENSGSIALAAGQRYDIRIDYYEGTGSAVAKLAWSSPSTPKATVPQLRLYPSTTVAFGEEIATGSSSDGAGGGRCGLGGGLALLAALSAALRAVRLRPRR